MKTSLKKGFSFGLTSGIITTLGMIVGLHSGTHSQLAVLGGILSIAVADAFSDALGIHISEESENHHSSTEIWEATLSTFGAKFIFAMSFVIPLLLFPLSTAIIVSVLWGLTLIALFSLYLARQRQARASRVIIEHLLIALAVIVITHYLGDRIRTFPG